MYGWDGVVGNYASPYTPGSAYVLLHHCFGEVNGKKGVWGHAIGGMGAITQAMAKSAATHGADIRVDAAVREVIVEQGRAVGVVTEKGEAIRARAVISNLNPKLLYGSLIDRAALPAAFAERIAKWRCGSGTFRMNVALSELPDFSCLPGRELAEHHTAGIIIAPSLAYMEQAYFDARTFGWSKKPIVEVVISSTLDDTLAPKGQHVASLFCQHVAPELPDGSSWDEHRETVADLMIDTVDRYAPNFKRSVLGRQIFSPLDLERTFGLVGGDIFHGALDLGQMFSARPMLGHADYRGPLPGLYMCGSGTHPGGGVTGLPGHNAAREILRDLKRRYSTIRRIGPWQRVEHLGGMRAAEVGRGGILTDLHDAAADRARAREMIEQRVAVAAPHRARELRQVFAELREHLQHRVLVVQEHVAPHRRIGRRDAGEIAKAAGRELQHLGARHGGEFLRGADDRVGDQMRQMAGDRQHHVVMLGRHHLDVRAERAPERVEFLDCGRIRAIGRRQDAPAVDEQFGKP